MRCTNCGGNANHCKCPMPVNAVAVGAPVDHTPHLPQAVTAESEQVDEQPPFKPGDYLLDEGYPEPIYVETIIEDRSYGRLRWLITSTEGTLHHADKCGHCMNDPNEPPYGYDENDHQIKELNERLDEIEVTALERADADTEAALASPEFTCPACGGKYFGRQIDTNTTHCHDQYDVGCLWRGKWTGKRYEQQLANRKPLIIDQNRGLAFRIAQLEADRDGARRALAGNIEVSERQLKEQYKTIERLSALYRAVGDLPTGGNDDGTMEVKCSVLRRIAVVFDSLRDLKISHLQPGTEADHGTRPSA